MSDSWIAEGVVEVRPAATPIEPARWMERLASIERVLADHGVPTDDVGQIVSELVLRDDRGFAWRYDGERWEWYDGTHWTPGAPAGVLWLQPFRLDQPVPPDPDFPEDEPLRLTGRAAGSLSGQDDRNAATMPS